MPRATAPSSPLFESPNLTDVRFVWDALVHEWHGEQCSLLLMRYHGIDLGTRRLVEGIAERLGLISTSVYVCYGYYDLMIRCWSTAAERQKLVSQLKARLPGVEIEEFSVFWIDYSGWSLCRERATEQKILDRWNDIADIVYGRGGAKTEEILQRLEANGIIHRYCPNSTEDRSQLYFYKVYVLLRRQTVEDDDLLIEKRVNRLADALGSLSFLRMPSVYYGSGRTIECAIKGLISSEEIGSLYVHVLELKKTLDSVGLFLRPMTMILANAGETDRDHLRLEMPGPDSRPVRQLKGHFSDLAEKWDDIDVSVRDAVVGVFDSYWSSVADTPFARHFLDLLRGGLEADNYKINASLNFLIVLEREFRTAVVSDLLPTNLGRKEWRKRVIGFLEDEMVRLLTMEELGEDKSGGAGKERLHAARILESVRSHPAGLGMGETIHLVRRLVDCELISAMSVDHWGGEEWLENYLSASQLRNDFAHGKLVPNKAWPLSRRESEEWAELANRVVEAGRLMGRLEGRGTPTSDGPD
jgi:hypothetical protein